MPETRRQATGDQDLYQSTTGWTILADIAAGTNVRRSTFAGLDTSGQTNCAQRKFDETTGGADSVDAIHECLSVSDGRDAMIDARNVE